MQATDGYYLLKGTLLDLWYKPTAHTVAWLEIRGSFWADKWLQSGAEHDPCKILALLPQNLDSFCKTLSMTDSVTSSCFVLSGRI
jgi:hypothetical protein